MFDRFPFFLCLLLASATACGAIRGNNRLNLGPAAGAGPVECDSGCTIEWQRVQVWINKHARTKIQLATDVIVQTYNPRGPQDVQRDRMFGFTAQREPLGAAKYKITIELTCNSAFGCGEDPDQLSSAFYYYARTGYDVLDGQKHVGIGP